MLPLYEFRWGQDRGAEAVSYFFKPGEEASRIKNDVDPHHSLPSSIKNGKFTT
jgi:hypothetical protein